MKIANIADAYRNPRRYFVHSLVVILRKARNEDRTESSERHQRECDHGSAPLSQMSLSNPVKKGELSQTIIYDTEQSEAESYSLPTIGVNKSRFRKVPRHTLFHRDR